MVVVEWYLLTPDGSRIRAVDRISIFICKLLIHISILVKDSATSLSRVRDIPFYLAYPQLGLDLSDNYSLPF